MTDCLIINKNIILYVTMKCFYFDNKYTKEKMQKLCYFKKVINIRKIKTIIFPHFTTTMLPDNQAKYSNGTTAAIYCQ